MSRLNTRLLIPMGVGLVLVLFWFLVLWGPQGSALSKAKKRSAAAVTERATLQDQLRRLQQAGRDQPLKQAQLETMRVAIPDDPNLAQFILDTNDAASRSGIDFLSISPTPPGTGGTSTAAPAAGATGGGGSPIRISMSVTGGYFQVLDFVNRLDRLPRIVVVDSLVIGSGTGAAAGTGAAPGQLQVAMQVRIFTTSTQPVAGSTGATGASGATTTTAPGGSTTSTRLGAGIVPTTATSAP
jgi:Tfp pilus assembly protein PilO